MKKTIQELVEEQIDLGLKIRDENPSVTHIMLLVKDLDPKEVADYAYETNLELNKSGKTLMVQAFSGIGTAIFIYSTPVKVTTTTTYEELNPEETKEPLPF